MTDSHCVISKQISVQGRISGHDALVIEGRVEGSVTVSRALTVAQQAVVIADVEADETTVEGELYGTVTSAKGVTIGTGGVVVGDIRAARVVINPGGRFKGHIEMDVELPPEFQA